VLPALSAPNGVEGFGSDLTEKTHPPGLRAFPGASRPETVKKLWELAGQQHSIRAIARELDLSRNTVRK
jgi:transposase-like protein